jgi:SAM-dependent methyltransferase
MARQARERDLEVQVASLREPASFANEGECDAITLLYAYGHLPSRKTRENLIHAAYRMLKPGGRFFFDAFDAEDDFEWGPEAVSQFHDQRLGQQGYEEGDVFYRRATGEHLAFLHYCSSDRLLGLMEAAGFVDIELTTIGYDQSVGVESHNGKLFVAGTRLA